MSPIIPCLREYPSNPFFFPVPDTVYIFNIADDTAFDVLEPRKYLWGGSLVSESFRPLSLTKNDSLY